MLISTEDFAKTQGLSKSVMQQRIVMFYGKKWPPRIRQGRFLLFDEQLALKCIEDNPWFARGKYTKGSHSRKIIEKQPFKFDGVYFDWITGKLSPNYEQKKRFRDAAKRIGYKNPQTVTVKLECDW